MQMEHFFPQIQVKTKKKSSSKIEHFFPQIQVKSKNKVFTKLEHFFPQFSLQCTLIQIIGGDTAKFFWGDILPYPTLASVPLFTSLVVFVGSMAEWVKASFLRRP